MTKREDENNTRGMTVTPCTGPAYVQVAVPLPLDDTLTYAFTPEDGVPERGSRVVVPVGRRKMVGVVWDHIKTPPDSFDIKFIHGILDPFPIFPASLFPFLEWISSYYFYPLGKVVAEALPPGILSAKQSKIEKIIKETGRNVKGRTKFASWPGRRHEHLTADQDRAIKKIRESIESNEFRPILIHGVTGSGKTEVYLQGTEICLSQGKSAIVLVPEIALTTQTIGWFKGRFGDRVVVLHSGLSEQQRLSSWWSIRKGDAKVVIGTRSAIFAPVADLGLVIVDEEHDSSYKQDEKLRYNSRDLAVLRGSMAKATVVLGSATPSITSYFHAVNGRYELISIDERVDHRPLPEVEIIKNSKRKKTGSSNKEKLPPWLSEQLFKEILSTVKKGNQALLFLNRRGFAPYIFCSDCGYVFRCAHCEVSLTWHRNASPDPSLLPSSEGILKCHYCGKEIPALPVCPSCSGQAVKATGYGTERVAEDLAELIPDVRIFRLDSDISMGRKRMEEIITRFQKGDIDILVGTQMVTKGHDFPGLTLVGVLWADFSLNFPEYLAAEKTFQLITQVAGRAGRGNEEGRVLIQTYFPEHSIFSFSKDHDFKGFFHYELPIRKQLGYPPFGRLINIKFSGKQEKQVQNAAESISELLRINAEHIKKRDHVSVEVLGPSPSPIPKIKDRFRWQVLLKSQSLSGLRTVCRSVLESKKKNRSVKVEIDVDPLSFL